MSKLLEAIGGYGVQCSETKELAPPQYLLDALAKHDAEVRRKVLEEAASHFELKGEDYDVIGNELIRMAEQPNALQNPTGAP
jgi:hypothetical protein